ncbi:MAG: recombination mediator RecR [bacterium]
MFPKPMRMLMDAFKKLPGIGPKAAYRMAVSILGMPYEEAREIARAIMLVKKSIALCSVCCNFTDVDPCLICSDGNRDQGFICVVEEPEDVEALERGGSHPGVYHVLGGRISALEGVGPEKLRVRELFERVKKGGVREVLIATDPNVEGEATAMHIARELKTLGVRATRPARGIPAGADIKYIDGDTLSQALRARQEL